MNRIDDLSRAVQLCVGPDGTVTIGMLYGPSKAHTMDWRSPVIDALYEGKVDTAKRLLSMNGNEPLSDDEAEPDCYTLPVFSVDTQEEARALRSFLCRLERTKHPMQPDEPWYRLTRFAVITVDDFPSIAEHMRSAYAQLKKARR